MFTVTDRFRLCFFIGLISYIIVTYIVSVSVLDQNNKKLAIGSTRISQNPETSAVPFFLFYCFSLLLAYISTSIIGTFYLNSKVNSIREDKLERFPRCNVNEFTEFTMLRNGQITRVKSDQRTEMTIEEHWRCVATLYILLVRSVWILCTFRFLVPLFDTYTVPSVYVFFVVVFYDTGLWILIVYLLFQFGLLLRSLVCLFKPSALDLNGPETVWVNLYWS